MAGGWSSITDDAGRYYGAGTMDTGGDVEEFAEQAYGMVWHLASQLAIQDAGSGPARREDALLWIEQAGSKWREGMVLGGRADGEGEEF